MFARSIEETLEQCITSKTFLEATGLYVILRFIGISDVNADMDKAILNWFSMSVFFFTPSLLQWRNSVVSWVFFQLPNNVHARASVPNIPQVFPPPFLDYSGDRDGGAL